MPLKTIPDCFQSIKSKFSNPKALNYRSDTGWHAISSEKFYEYVETIGLGLVSLGLKKGDKVGIHAYPSPYWTIVDMAIMSVGCVSVPLFANIAEENYVYESTHSEMKVIFLEGDEQWDMFRRHKLLFHHAISIGTNHPADVGVISFEELSKRGKELQIEQPDLFNQIGASIQPHDLASIIFTSGSTGVPKGVLLSHSNFICVSEFNRFNWDGKNDRYLSILPLAHVLGHCVNLWALVWGISIYYSNDYKNLGAICREVEPTITVVVPRLLEKIYIKIIEQIEHSSYVKRKLGLWAVNLTKKNDSWLKKIAHPLADILVYKKFRKALGGHLRVVLSGGAPLNPALHRFFGEIGIKIYEGWGLTEACPVCVNLPEKNKVGTVGPPLQDHRLAISADGEVLVKGPLVMMGYYKAPEATEKVIDKEGWLHTGDRGLLDEDGYLTILGRMKELYKTSTGEYVAPVPIEQALSRCPFIEMSMVVAEGKKFTSCLLFPNFELLKNIKKQRKMSHISDEEFLAGPYIRKEMEKLLNEINTHLNHWEQVHDYRFVMEPLTIESGALTPSMKIRREVVAKKYQDLINSMYNEEVA